MCCLSHVFKPLLLSFDLFTRADDMLPDMDDDEDEPDWLKTEREQFAAFRDKDGDGKLSRQEVAEWIMPEDYDHSEAETKHLLFESDGDRVRKPLIKFSLDSINYTFTVVIILHLLNRILSCYNIGLHLLKIKSLDNFHNFTKTLMYNY